MGSVLSGKTEMTLKTRWAVWQANKHRNTDIPTPLWKTFDIIISGGRQLLVVVRGNGGSGNKPGTVTCLLDLAAACYITYLLCIHTHLDFKYQVLKLTSSRLTMKRASRLHFLLLVAEQPFILFRDLLETSAVATRLTLSTSERS